MPHSFDTSAAGQQPQESNSMRVDPSNFESEPAHAGPSRSGDTPQYTGDLSMVPANYQWPQPSPAVFRFFAGAQNAPDQGNSMAFRSAALRPVTDPTQVEDPTTAQQLDLDSDSSDEVLFEGNSAPKRHRTEAKHFPSSMGMSGPKRRVVEVDHSASLRQKNCKLMNDLASAKLTAGHRTVRMTGRLDDAKRYYEARIEAQNTVLDKYASQFSEFNALLADQRKQQTAMKSGYDARIADLCAKNEEALKQQVEMIKTDYKRLETSAQVRYESMLADIRSKHGEALQNRKEAMEADYKRLETSIRTQYEATLNEDREALRRQAELIKAEYNGQLETEMRRLEARKEDELAALEQRIDTRVLKALRSAQNHNQHRSPAQPSDEPTSQSTWAEPAITSPLTGAPSDDAVREIQPRGHSPLARRVTQPIRRLTPLHMNKAHEEASTSRQHTPRLSPALRTTGHYTPRISHGKGRVYPSRTTLVGYKQAPSPRVQPDPPPTSRRSHLNIRTPNPVDDDIDDLSDESERKPHRPMGGQPRTRKTKDAYFDVSARTRSAYLGFIRKVFKGGSGTNHGERVVVLETTATPDLIQSYDMGGPGPSLLGLQFDMRANEKSRWNQRGIFILLQHAIDLKTEDKWRSLPPLGQIEAEFLRDLITKKFNRLRQKWRDSRQKLKGDGTVETIEESEARMVSKVDAHSKRSRRDKRRISKYERRVEIVTAMIDIKDDAQAEDVEVWVWLSNVLEHLGKDGMSSEESSDGGGDLGPVYRVKILDWRRRIDKELDLIDGIRFKDHGIFNPQGSMPRPRRRSSVNQLSNRRPVTGLPESFYDQEWLEAQSEEYRHITLCTSEEAFSWLSVYARQE